MLFQYLHKISLLKINNKIYRFIINNKGFTLIESTVTLFVSVVVLMFLPMIFTSIQSITYQFNDIKMTNYLLFHQQLTALYNKSEQVIIKNNHIYCIMPDQSQHEITILPNKIIKATKHHQKFQGYSPMLLHVNTKLSIIHNNLYLIIEQGQYHHEIKLTNKKKSPR